MGPDGVHIGATLANTTEPSMCGGDAALYQITLTTSTRFGSVRQIKLASSLQLLGARRCAVSYRIVS